MAKKSVKQQIQEKHEYFSDAVDSMGVDQLKTQILSYTKETENVTKALEQLCEPGEALYLAKAAVSEITGPINDTKKALKLKISYLALLVEEKGGSLP